MASEMDWNALKICIIIPTYNNAKTLQAVLASAEEYWGNLIVINDGSTDDTTNILAQFPKIAVINHPINKGKGHALKSGFRYAANNNYSHAITLDADGQHFTSDIPALAKEIHQHPDAMIIGCRTLENSGQSKGSNFANRFANFWYFVETGTRVTDTQSGFRAYPLHKLKGMHFFTGHYDFELEVLVKAAWKGIAIKEIPIQVYYAPPKERVSHFKPVKDFARIGLLNIWLVTLAIFWYRPLLFIKGLSISKIKNAFKSAFNDPTETAVQKSNAVALGILFGILPIWGYQMVLALLIAYLLKWNKAIVFITAQISIPPMIPAILYVSVITGEWVTGVDFKFSLYNLSITTVKEHLYVYITGACVFAVLAAALSWLVSYGLFRFIAKK